MNIRRSKYQQLESAPRSWGLSASGASSEHQQVPSQNSHQAGQMEWEPGMGQPYIWAGYVCVHTLEELESVHPELLERGTGSARWCCLSADLCSQPCVLGYVHLCIMHLCLCVCLLAIHDQSLYWLDLATGTAEAFLFSGCPTWHPLTTSISAPKQLLDVCTFWLEK